MDRREALTTLAALALGVSRAGASTQQVGREAAIVEKATAALTAITESKRNGIPLALLREAQGLVIVPDLIKAGFVFGGQAGRGILVARDEAGAWTNPVFLGVAGGSFGAQIGAEATDLILVFRTKPSVDDFLRHNKIKLGAGVEAAAGPVGVDLEAATDLRMRAEILSYSRSRGLFAGASVKGSSLHIRHKANDSYYGVPNLMVGDILAGKDFEDKPLNVPPSAVKLRGILNALTLPPEADRAAEKSRKDVKRG